MGRIVTKSAKNVLLFIGMFFISSLTSAQTVLTFSQIDDIADQFVIAEVLKVAYGKIDVSVKFVSMPAKRAINESNSGRLDGEIYRIEEINKFYPNLKRVPTPVYYIEPSIFTKQQDIFIPNCFSIKNLSVGIVRGVKHSELCTKDLNNVQVFSYPKTMMKMINAEKIDIGILSKNNGIALLKQLNIDSVKPIEPPLQSIPVYHYLHEQHIEVIPKIDRVLAEMTASGEIEQIKRNAFIDLFKRYENN